MHMAVYASSSLQRLQCLPALRATYAPAEEGSGFATGGSGSSSSGGGGGGSQSGSTRVQGSRQARAATSTRVTFYSNDQVLSNCMYY